LIGKIKGKGYNMKRIVFILMLVITSTAVFALGMDGTPLTKKEKKTAELEKQYQLNKYMLENKDFVLQANYLENKYGNRFIVDRSINFVAVDSTIAVIQVGSDAARLGANGVGGVTAKGKITRWKLKENIKQRTFYLSMSVMTSIGVYDLQFTIGPSENTMALLTGITAGQLTFDGDLVPHSESSVYEGASY